ncbi:hypothetical protein U9R90_25060 [Streptomyces sp. E11-3]|uniref:hypothetical protein n=1 Tax=Streptomyces sp. E11-3 TaxID=3110112 RepID=UPI00397F6E42
MTRLARALCSLHSAALVWLAYCTITTARYGAAWAAILFAAASLMSVIAVIREMDAGDRAYAARHHAPAAEAEDQAALLDDAVRDLDNACCERWWTALGTDHDPTCPVQQPRSDAA